MIPALIKALPASWLSDGLVLKHRCIPEPLWQSTLRACPWLTWRSPQALERVRTLSTLFLARKQFAVMGGLVLDDAMALRIAAQACLPIAQWQLGLAPYGQFVGVVVHPDQVSVRRSWMDERSGVVHEGHETLSGEAMPHGPIMLSWQDILLSGAEEHDASGSPGAAAYNVVIHEFVHALDAWHEEATGTPPLPAHISEHRWQTTLWQCFDELSNAHAHGDHTVIDPYALEDGLVELFPVLAETFFMTPKTLQAAHPEVYSLLQDYFLDDPARWAPV
jgi:MtfA peptidase